MRRLWRPAARVVSVCLALSASGCFTAQEWAAGDGARIEPGMTMEEVLYQLGDPHVVVKGDPGTDTEWIYRYESGPSAAAYVLLIVFFVALIAVLVVASAKGGGGGSFGGGGWGGSDGPPYQIKIRFGPDGHVVDVSPPHPVPGN
jgi:outer membrane protein assembly factor BamE (lipoprotein component of BamABCDE complex)